MKLKYKQARPSLAEPPRDEEAEAVRNAPPSSDEDDEEIQAELEEQERKEAPKTPESKTTPPTSPQAQLRAPMVDERGTKRPAEEQPEPPTEAGSQMDTEESRKRALPAEAWQAEGSPTRARTEVAASPTGSPTAERPLYPPSFAGNVARVQAVEGLTVATLYECGDQFLFETNSEEEENSFDFGEDKDELVKVFWDNEDLEHEPTVTAQELAELDEEAFQKEVTRLLEMGVLRKEKKEKLRDDYVELSTTAVQDWRHRDGEWKRRSRLVAREYKWADPTRQDLFSSATAASQVRLLAAVMMTERDLEMWSLDIKDAFLQVPQEQRTFVRPPRGYEHLLEEDEVWVLERLFPGQRAGTKVWGLFLQDMLKEEHYQPLALSPNLFAKWTSWYTWMTSN